MTQYKCLQYHWKHISQKRFFFTSIPVIKQGVTSQHFTNRAVMLDMLNYWSGGEWNYWESKEDRITNMGAGLVELPYLSIGFYGNANHHHEFNTIKPRYAY